jgi:hypothetical protein
MQTVSKLHEVGSVVVDVVVAEVSAKHQQPVDLEVLYRKNGCHVLVVPGSWLLLIRKFVDARQTSFVNDLVLEELLLPRPIWKEF